MTHCLVSTASGQDIFAVRIESQTVDLSVVCFMLLHNPYTAVKQLSRAVLDSIHACTLVGIRVGIKLDFSFLAEMDYIKEACNSSVTRPVCRAVCACKKLQHEGNRHNDTAQLSRCCRKCNACCCFDACWSQKAQWMKPGAANLSAACVCHSTIVTSSHPNDHVAIPTSHCYPNNYITISKST